MNAAGRGDEPEARIAACDSCERPRFALAMPKSPRPNCFPATEQATPPRPALDHRLPPAGRSGLGTGLPNRATFFLFANANCEPAAFERTRNYLPEELRWAASAKLLRARFS